MLLPLSCSRQDTLITTLLVTLTRSRMETGGAGSGRGEGGGPGQPGEALILHNLRVAPYIEGEI